jgi:hypothetical protein
MSKEFREFIASWIETGFKWYAENPEHITKWKFGHDYTNDWCFKFQRNEDGKWVSYFRKEQDIICELIPMLIVHVKEPTEDIASLLQWLRRDHIVAPHDYHMGWKDFFVRQFAYTVYNLLETK